MVCIFIFYTIVNVKEDKVGAYLCYLFWWFSHCVVSRGSSGSGGLWGPWIYLVLVHPTDAWSDWVLQSFDQQFFLFVCFFFVVALAIGESGVCQSEIHANFTTQDFPRTLLPNKMISVTHLTFQWFKCCGYSVDMVCYMVVVSFTLLPKSYIYSYPMKLLIFNTLFSVIF